ncbi:hypothetical protein Bca52824_055238 [Brassica carinata]|uniref:Uncharacterized protein n=1 Tax=Brassica carinata TaxID=52824 RepID=A0A8X7R7A0_BRACI|nr:hypothetical protein Bca52824_055238 [Brassica carinata]
MREPSMLVRESAVEQLEERQNDWADSNDEKSNTQLRVLIIGYGLQCVMHMFCVCVEYRKRSNRIQISPYSMEDQYLESGSQRFCIVLFGINVFFVVFYVALACVAGIAGCCCFHCIIAVLYAVAKHLLLSC